jgi:signal transduction histidine kinase
LKKIITEQAKIAYLRIINEFTVNLLNQDSIEGIAWSITKDAIAHLGFEDCVVYLVENGILVQKAAHGAKNPNEYKIINCIKIPIGQGIVGTVAKTGQALIISDTSMDERYIEDDENRLSELTVPIIFENKVIGVIDSENAERNFFTNEHLSIVTTIASMAATKIGQAKAKKALKLANEQLENLVKERTQDLEVALDNVRLANDDLEQFAYNASHDLRQPLRMISSYIQLLKRRYSNDLDEVAMEYIDFAYNGAIQAQKLVNDLLQYAQVGVNANDFELLNLNQILENVLINLRTEIRVIEPEIIISDLPNIWGVKTLVIQLFQNLIHNALKFKSSEKAKIQIRFTEKKNHFLFEVKDNGLGISKKEHHSIFDLFSRSVSHESIKGTGLGLSMCKKIVLKHDGKIWLTSEVGSGSSFFFSLKKQA